MSETTDTTRAALAAALDEWQAAGGDERDPESVARLLRAVFEGEWLVGGTYIVRADGPRWNQPESVDVSLPGWSPRANGQWLDVETPLDALCALAAAGVPVRAEGEPDAERAAFAAACEEDRRTGGCGCPECVAERLSVPPPSAPAPPISMLAQPTVYVASKTRHAARWRALRDSGVPIVSTWIDEAGAGETLDWPGLWRRCLSEAVTADEFVLYAEAGDVLRGAFVEAGARLAAGKRIVYIGPPECVGNLLRSDLVTHADAVVAEMIGEARSAPAPGEGEARPRTVCATCHGERCVSDGTDSGEYDPCPDCQPEALRAEREHWSEIERRAFALAEHFGLSGERAGDYFFGTGILPGGAAPGEGEGTDEDAGADVPTYVEARFTVARSTRTGDLRQTGRRITTVAPAYAVREAVEQGWAGNLYGHSLAKLLFEDDRYPRTAPAACPDCAALRARVAELETDRDQAVVAFDGERAESDRLRAALIASSPGKLVEALSARCSRLAAYVRANEACENFASGDDAAAVQAAYDAARAELLPGDVPAGGGDGR